VDALALDPGAGFSFGDCAFFDGPRPVRTLKGDASYAKTIERSMPQLNHPTVFVRRSVYERVGLFRRHFRIAMDYDFLLRVHRAGIHGTYVPSVITEMDLGGVSNQRVLKGYRECLEAALDQGVAPAPALARFATGSVGHLGKRALLKVGANSVIERLEKLRYAMAE
jgi:glycosyltransferase